jgi:hypothetical protein
MTRGSLDTYLNELPATESKGSVMSGIITGPYFKQFFDTPGPIEVGTMVAVLELGALGIFLLISFTLYNDIP